MSYCETAGHTNKTIQSQHGCLHQVCVMCGHERSHDEIVGDAIEQITRAYDGPPSPFVIISNAMQAVAKGAHPNAMATAVAIVLDVRQ